MNEEILCIINKGKTVKTEWENVTGFLRALYSLYKKLGQFFFHTYSLTSSNKDTSVLLKDINIWLS